MEHREALSESKRKQSVNKVVNKYVNNADFVNKVLVNNVNKLFEIVYNFVYALKPCATRAEGVL